MHLYIEEVLRVLEQLFGHVRDEVVADWKKLHTIYSPISLFVT
jgi:hypothetical protein